MSAVLSRNIKLYRNVVARDVVARGNCGFAEKRHATLWWFKIGQTVSGPYEGTQLYTCTKIIKRANIDIGLSPVGPFKPFSVVFPDHRVAFMIEPDPNVWNARR